RKRDLMSQSLALDLEKSQIRSVIVFYAENRSQSKGARRAITEFLEKVDGRSHRLPTGPLAEDEGSARVSAEFAGHVTVGYDPVRLHQPARTDPIEPRIVLHFDSAHRANGGQQAGPATAEAIAPDLAFGIGEGELGFVVGYGEHRPSGA